MTTSLQHQPSVEAEQREPPFSPTLVEGWAQTLGKAVRAHQLYLPNNPVYQRAIEQLRAAFHALWAETDQLTLVITEAELRWEGRVVASEPTDMRGTRAGWPWIRTSLHSVAVVPVAVGVSPARCARSTSPWRTARRSCPCAGSSTDPTGRRGPSRRRCRAGPS